MTPRVAALVPMRHDSERVPGKNYRPLGGQPLFHHIVRTLLETSLISKVVIDTDSNVIRDDAKAAFPGVEVLGRPEHLRAGTVPMNDVLLNDVRRVDADIYLQTHSTNPLLRSESIRRAIEAFLMDDAADSLFGVTRLQTRLWTADGSPLNHDPKTLVRTQDLPVVYEENSCIYLFTRSSIERHGSRIGEHPILFEVPPDEAWDIDGELDFEVVEALYERRLPRMTGITVLITCPQLQRTLDQHRARIDVRGIQLIVPEVVQQLSEPELLELIPGVDGIIAGDDQITRKVQRADRLRIVSKWGVGTDNIDLPAASELGVRVTNTPGMFDDEVADVVVGYIVMLARHLHETDRQIRNGSWAKLEGVSLAGRTLGIIGLGNIGQAVARRGLAMGMRLLGTDIATDKQESATKLGVEVTDLGSVVASADVLSLNCPLTSQTWHMLDAPRLATMKPGAWIVNTARGALIDEEALAAALAEGRIGAAALDVFEVEPLPPDSPLRQRRNVILGAHNSSNTAEAGHRTSEKAIDNLLAGLDEVRR